MSTSPPSQTNGESLKSPNAIPWIVLMVSALLHFSSIQKGFSLDETRTVWNTSTGFPALLERVAAFEGHGPLYFSIIWVLRQWGLSSEIALRLPSVVFFLLSCCAVGKLAHLLFGRGGVLAPCFLALLPEFAANSTNARSYSLVVLLATCTFLCFAQWLRSLNPRFLWWYGCATVALLYTHPIFGGTVVAHLLVILFTGTPIRSFLWCCVGITVLSLPVVNKFITLAQHRQVWSWADPPTLSKIAAATLQPKLLLLVGLALTLALLASHRQKRALPNNQKLFSSVFRSKADLLLLTVWCLLPGILAGGISALTGSSILSLRYYQWCIPGIALTLTGLTLSLHHRPQKLFFLLLSAPLLSLIPATEAVTEDWREAVSEVRRLKMETPALSVVTYTGFIEAQDSSFLRSPEGRASLLSPLLAYAPEIEADPLPTLFSQPGAEDYLTNTLPPPTPNGLTLLVRKSWLGDTDSINYLQSELEKRGWRKKSISRYGIVAVILFQPSAPTT